MDASAEANKADYRQLMEDSGWHLVTKSDTWCYWRQGAAQGKPLEIFSDAESKIAQYKHVIFTYVGVLGATAPIINILADSTTMSMPVKMIFAALYIPGLTWTLYRMLRLRRRIKQLRRD